MKRILFALVLFSTLAWGQALEVISLRHRSAEQLLPQIAPFVEPGGVLVSETLVQYDIGTGFVAVPQLNGERVTIAISLRDDTLGRQPGTINTQQLLTTVSGRLGEWLELGGSVGEQSGSSGAIAGYGTQSASRQRRLLLKVEELR